MNEHALRVILKLQPLLISFVQGSRAKARKGTFRWTISFVLLALRRIESAISCGTKNEIENPFLENDAQLPKVGNGTTEESTEIRLRDFIVEATGGVPVLMCNVTVGSMDLDRLPLFELEFPTDGTLPSKSEHRFPLELHGMRVTLTAKAAEVLHAFSISVLQRGSLTRATGSLFLNEESDEIPYPADRDAIRFSSPETSESVSTQQRS
jgi:hypothetical protein